MDDPENSRDTARFNGDGFVEHKNSLMVYPEDKTIESMETEFKSMDIRESENPVIKPLKDPYMNFSFISNINTITWIKSNPVMFIMRG